MNDFKERICKKIEKITNRDVSLVEKLDCLAELRESYDTFFDEMIQIIDTTSSDLEKEKCNFCEGLGEYKYREWFDVCKHCGGTGYARN